MISRIRAQNVIGGKADRMFTESPGTDLSRIRLAIVILVIGIVMILWSWGNWVYRASTPPLEVPLAQTQSDAPDALRVKAVSHLPQILMYSLIIGVVALFGGYAVLRASRRYYEAADRKRAGPTVTPDAWAMHKVSHYNDDEDGVEQPGE